MKRKALFLDRDGVVNVDSGYVHEPSTCVFMDTIFDIVRGANRAGYAVVLITNQAGIGRGYFSLDQFQTFTQWMLAEFEQRDARIDRVYFCPHHPEFGLGQYRLACDCRKPQPGMLIQARDDLDLDMASSLMVGDKHSDLEAAARAGVGHRFLFTPAGEENVELPLALGTRIALLSELMPWFEQNELAEPAHQPAPSTTISDETTSLKKGLPTAFR
jgi:D-glycero-D-manno-heptose 1,7-bisphosphate phosphatase